MFGWEGNDAPRPLALTPFYLILLNSCLSLQSSEPRTFPLGTFMW